MKWTAFTDGGARVSNPGLGACAFVLKKDGAVYQRYWRFLGDSVTNNEAEYQGLISLLEYITDKKIHGVTINSDSQLMVKQINGEYRCSNPELAKLRNYAYLLLYQSGSLMVWVPRELNTEADALVNHCLDRIEKERNGTPSQEVAPSQAVTDCSDSGPYTTDSI